MNKPADVEALKQLALRGGFDGAVELASNEFAELLQMSQQTASRRLIELAEAGLISREMGLRKQRVKLTPKGRSLLQAEHQQYQRMFAGGGSLKFKGTVKAGLGEGRYYLSRPGYKTQFVRLLGWDPYPGTLNLELSGADAEKLAMLREHPVHSIQSFQAEGRTFGGATCHDARIGRHACATILPHRTHYTTTLEVIGPARLRDVVPCQDGDELEVHVALRPGDAP